MIHQLLEKNDLGIVYVCGDLHGSYSLLMQKLKEINFNFDLDLLICTGDLIDRGLENLECISLLDENWFKTVRGNHEKLCIEGYQDISCMQLHSYPQNGGFWFYQLDKNIQKDIYTKFNKLPHSVEIMINNKKIGICHADCPDDWETLKIENNLTEDFLLWSRKRFHDDRSEKIKNIDHVFFGHSIVQTIFQENNYTFIDTGAYRTKVLTILNIKEYLNI